MLPELKKDTLLRLNVIRGHLQGIQQMVEQDVYCVDVMKQVAAVQASLEKVNRIVLRNHLLTCVSEAARSGDMEKMVDELLGSLKYNKSLTDGRLWAQEDLVSLTNEGVVGSPGDACCSSSNDLAKAP
ncbi:MAG: metal-sensitive transcriptional regulator [Chloroflexi bacterium]|nr:metal-sensitive transcriptional regulator [Chloroflexota bacterium]